MSSPALNSTETCLEPLRLSLDVGFEQATAQLRLAAAVLAGVAGIWLAWVEQSMWLRITALASAAFAARWIAGFRKTQRTARAAAAHFLEITTQRVTLAAGTHQRSVPFDRVQRIELDEDRLTVVMRMTDGEELVIEPVYGGLGLRELGETLQRYLSWQRSRNVAGCTERNP